MTDDDARRLSAGIASGDPEAFSRLYRLRHDDLMHMIRRATRRDDAFAHDVLHDAMLKVTRAMPPLPGAAALDAWLRRTVLTTALDRLRGERRRANRETYHAQHTPIHTSPDRDRSDVTAELESLLGALAAEEQYLLSMRYGLEWSLARISAALGLGTGAVDGRIRRLTERLRARNLPEREHFDA